jgi:hypothetical protein
MIEFQWTIALAQQTQSDCLSRQIKIQKSMVIALIFKCLILQLCRTSTEQDRDQSLP